MNQTGPIVLPRTRTRDRKTTSAIPLTPRSPPSPGDSLIERAMPPSETVRRVSRILLLRTIVISIVLLLSVWLLSFEEQPTRGAIWFQSSLIAVTYASSVIFGVLLRRNRSPKKIARAMVAADLVVTSLLVYATGGALSPYVFLYAFSIVGAGALAYRRGAVIASAASFAALLAISIIAWAHVQLVPASSQLHPWEQAGAALVRTLAVDFAALIGVGALAYIFGDQVERGAETLATTRRAAAELLSLHRDIVRSLSSGLITTNTENTILTANETAADILHVELEALSGKSIETALPGLLALLADHTELRRADLTLPNDLVIGVTVSPLRDDTDAVIGRVINFSDLTELRRLETHMRRADRLATVGQLAAGVAHEIRNPLASISGSIELLRSTETASEDDRALMNIVHREIQRLNTLITDLLDYANPKAREVVDFDLATLVREVLQVAKGDHAFDAIEVASTLADTLPMKADPAKLRQVLWNLLRNASDAAAAGGKHVMVEASGDDNLITITVGDDGPGIPAEQLKRIFDPFFTTKRKGTGLGLATCHAIVAEHGGRIDVESEPGKTRFFIRLPR